VDADGIDARSQAEPPDETQWRFDGLRALYINCTLKRSPEVSHTQGLIEVSAAIMTRHGAEWVCSG
jgi:hypothetical protein